MVKIVCKLALIVAFAAPATLGCAENWSDVALKLANLLGSEKFCGLTYDQSAISKFISTHVDDRELEFASMLDLYTSGVMSGLDELTESQKTARCTQIKRNALRYGFVH